ncbi:MAG: 16S rRNA (adenine(1518)-N(6)/adenine(1519)-N(6))-dimethyltransferase RsmA [Proteobacteria bacterium]|uniref:Ribosomal RNA small subunit methyltransferase A n=1 Tax=Candidatus Enterousia excrementavium TaxID=2840789 RepID=A0A940DEE1_9PROT|nr:16S rRNA (adenine(1518)-N(6)/adenine(1519)-N(6))-dimethyltransferase RsmA [Candidatus Enterousia excrementavium]
MNEKIKSLPPVSEMMRNAGMVAKKQFGQNFLFDLNLTGRIARSVPNLANTTVVEVGPGPGGLTRALLLAGARQVIAIEKDKTTSPILDAIVDAADGRLTVIYDDALRVNFRALGVDSYAICANLPYNVGTELLIQWLIAAAHGEKITSLTLMFQREVAYRITARPRDEHYGRLAVLTSLIADARILFDVPNTAFVPRPRVQSAVVQIIPNAKKISALRDVEKVEKITALLFGHRRKMIRGIMPNVDWAKYGLAGTERAEELSPEMFAQLAHDLL